VRRSGLSRNLETLLLAAHRATPRCRPWIDDALDQGGEHLEGVAFSSR